MNGTLAAVEHGNPNDAERRGSVTIRTICHSISRTVTVRQLGNNPAIGLYQPIWAVDYRGGEIDISVTTNAGNWEILDYPSWLTVTRTNGYITVIADPNTTDLGNHIREAMSSVVWKPHGLPMARCHHADDVPHNAGVCLYRGRGCPCVAGGGRGGEGGLWEK